MKNGTEAKDIALYFIAKTGGRATSSFVSKTISQANHLLEANYTKKEIIDVIDYVVKEKNIILYSLGYLNACIHKLIPEIEAKNEIRLAKENQSNQVIKEVVNHGESSERNRNKLHRFGFESRFREKFNFDMFERREQSN